jgi:hypothetical protein
VDVRMDLFQTVMGLKYEAVEVDMDEIPELIG